MNELIYGIHTVESLLNYDFHCFLHVYVLNSSSNKRLLLLLKQLKTIGIPVTYCNREYLNNKVQCIMHQGIIAEVCRKNIFAERDILHFLQETSKKYLLLVLDSIMDPRNLGSCLRSAGAFGVDAVIIPRHRSVSLSGVVWKVASGIADSIPVIRVTNLVRVLRLLKQFDIWIVGTVPQEQSSIFQSKLSHLRLAVVMGSEQSGIRSLTRRYCDELVSIPMVSSFFSLNVSVATGIFLFEILRQRFYCKV